MIDLTDPRSCCATCRFWKRNADNFWGVCRLHPPTVMSCGEFPGLIGPESHFPDVDEEEWCGGYERTRITTEPQ